MAHAVPSHGSPSDEHGRDHTEHSEHDEHNVGEVAADHATELYVEQEHESRRERFERQVRKAATTTP